MARSDTPQKRGKKKKSDPGKLSAKEEKHRALKRLTAKQAKLVKGLAQGKTKTQAGIDAGYSEKSVGPIVNETLRNPNVQDALKDLMDRMGLGDEQLLQTLKEGLKADRVISAIAGHEANGGTTDFIEVPDHFIRQKFLDTAFKLRGSYAAQKLAHEGEIGLLGVVVLPEVKEGAPSDSDPESSD